MANRVWVNRIEEKVIVRDYGDDPKVSSLGELSKLLTLFIQAKYCGARVGIKSGEWVGSVVNSGQVNFGCL